MNRRLILTAALSLVVGLSAQNANAQRPTPDGVREKMRGTSHADIQGSRDNGPKVGKVAPDFRLSPLKFYEFGIDEEAITEENAGKLYVPVRLSSFKGKKPVVLIFGSYT